MLSESVASAASSASGEAAASTAAAATAASASRARTVNLGGLNVVRAGVSQPEIHISRIDDLA